MTASQTRKVIVHVGAPKTGTSFLQDLLFTHRDTLARLRAGTENRFDGVRLWRKRPAA